MLAVLGVAVLTAVAVFLGVVSRRAGRSGGVDGSSSQVSEAVELSTRRWRTAGLALGVVTGGAVASFDALGRGVSLAVPVAFLGLVAGVVVGEVRVAAPDGPVRSAGLGTRRVRDVLPRGLSRAVATAAVVLAAVLVATTATGSPDDLGRPGRTLQRTCDAVSSVRTGPWPGSFYSVPLAAALVLGCLAAVGALHRVARRPRPGPDLTGDDAVRRRSAEAVVAASGLLVAVPFAGVATLAGAAVLSTTCRPAWWTVLGWAFVAAVPALLGLGAWCTAVLLTPGRRREPGPARRRLAAW